MVDAVSAATIWSGAEIKCDGGRGIAPGRCLLFIKHSMAGAGLRRLHKPALSDASSRA